MFLSFRVRWRLMNRMCEAVIGRTPAIGRGSSRGLVCLPFCIYSKDRSERVSPCAQVPVTTCQSNATISTHPHCFGLPVSSFDRRWDEARRAQPHETPPHLQSRRFFSSYYVTSPLRSRGRGAYADSPNQIVLAKSKSVRPFPAGNDCFRAPARSFQPTAILWRPVHQPPFTFLPLGKKSCL
jgi:hypothetical protein